MTTDDKEKTGLKMEERRRFMELTAKFGFTAATVALFSGVLNAPEASAQMAKEEGLFTFGDVAEAITGTGAAPRPVARSVASHPAGRTRSAGRASANPGSPASSASAITSALGTSPGGP